MIGDSRILYIVHRKAPWGLYYSEDNLLIEYLSRKINTKVVDWEKLSMSKVNMNDVIICRNPKSWINRKDKFIYWLKNVEKSGYCMLNSPKCIYAGISKKYLLNFSSLGLPVVPTMLIDKENKNITVPWENCVIKPCVGESNLGVKKINRASITADYISRYYLKYGFFLIQEYQESISEGGISTIFVDGKFMYAIKTQPKQGGFLTTWQSARECEVKNDLIRMGQKCIKSWGQKCAFVRIDWLRGKEGFLVSEFEVIDPMFFHSCLSRKKQNYFFKNIYNCIIK